MKGKFNLNIEEKMEEFQRLMEELYPKKVFYKKMFFGKGPEFDGYRNFLSCDDASLIDWKASKRANALLLKEYEEERDLNVMIILDVGENMVFGSGKQLKCEYCAEMIVALSNVILSKGDNIGFMLFNDHVLKALMPSKQLEVVRYEVSDSKNYGGISDLSKAFKGIIENLEPSITLVIIISDFINMNEDVKKDLERVGHIYETIALIVKDPLDVSLPNVNKEIVIEDIKTHEKLLINSDLASKIYELNARKQSESVKKLFFNSNIDYLELFINEDFALKLANFLKNRVEPGGR